MTNSRWNRTDLLDENSRWNRTDLHHLALLLDISFLFLDQSCASCVRGVLFFSIYPLVVVDVAIARSRESTSALFALQSIITERSQIIISGQLNASWRAAREASGCKPVSSARAMQFCRNVRCSRQVSRYRGIKSR